jgi:hypothetical protein
VNATSWRGAAVAGPLSRSATASTTSSPPRGEKFTSFTLTGTRPWRPATRGTSSFLTITRE